MKINREFMIGDRQISEVDPTYFIADIAANHDGNLDVAIELIHKAAECGADAAKFQHFTAATIVSDKGFKNLGSQQSHQAAWKKSVFEVYQDASINRSWTDTLKRECDKAGIHFFTSPYSFELVDEVNSYVPAFKIGSGDITWIDIIEYMAKKNKPLFLACGASSFEDAHRAVLAAQQFNQDIVLMQCNTNYTASLENFKYINLNVLKTFKNFYPDMVLGLSDHTPGHSTVLGAVTLGARVIEKHFTLNNDLEGPDHKFSMNPSSWTEMVDRTRELEQALGDGFKKIEGNEVETAVLQRRSVRFREDVRAGTTLTRDHLECLRPCPAGAVEPFDVDKVIGRKLEIDMFSGDHLTWKMLE